MVFVQIIFFHLRFVKIDRKIFTLVVNILSFGTRSYFKSYFMISWHAVQDLFDLRQQVRVIFLILESRFNLAALTSNPTLLSFAWDYNIWNEQIFARRLVFSVQVISNMRTGNLILRYRLSARGKLHQISWPLTSHHRKSWPLAGKDFCQFNQ